MIIIGFAANPVAMNQLFALFEPTLYNVGALRALPNGEIVATKSAANALHASRSRALNLGALASV